ncbi:MAG: tape measure protein, partial [bacterium]|nr:tape measure protein [bacterium]
MADSSILREDVVRVTIETDTSGLRTAEQQTDRLANDLGRLGGAGNEAENSLNNLGGTAEQMGEDVEGANSELDMLRRISGQLDGGLATLTSILERMGNQERRNSSNTQDLRQQLIKLGQEKLTQLSNALDNIAKKLGGAVVNAAKSALTALRNFAVAGATAIGGLIAVGVKYNSTMEQFQTSFTTMLGSADKAVDFTEKLRQMAAKTPFGMNDLAQASQTLLGYGIAEKEVLPYLKQLGDISQGNKDKLQGLTLAFSQAMSTGKLMGQDLLQMINQGFNPLKNIAERTGKSIGQLKEEMSKGAISAEMVAQAFEDATSEGGLFYNAMEKQSQTFNGQISTLKDNWSAFIGEMTSGIQELLKNTALPAINEQLKAFKEAFEEDGFRGIIRKFGVFGDYLDFCGDA